MANLNIQSSTGNPLILWIHGFAGKPNNDNFQEMARKYPAFDWFSIEVDHHALQSIDKINAYIHSHPEIVIVAGTSLGGYYAMCADFSGPKLVVNPAVDPLEEMKMFIGHNTYKPGRPDGQTDFIFTDEMRLEFGKLHMQNLDNVYCQYTMHDQVLGEDVKLLYEKMFIHRELVPENILPGHFLTFKYVKKAMCNALSYISDNFLPY